jgi:acetylglutamate kinase
MARKTALIKISGDLLSKKEVTEKIREISQEYFTVVTVGGGTQISEAFQQKGFPIKFGPLGRETGSLEEKQLARDVLEKNQMEIQDFLAAEGIVATVIVPFTDVASVLCPINGDVFVLAAYLGFDELHVFTLKERTEKKRKEFEKYPKIKVTGF